ncbi:hypothetical protein BC826DRAFT_1021271 [Russula brevipes]|nr:hypothetical protein BC826DRAFT_1021271 [Russula brevipes]
MRGLLGKGLATFLSLLSLGIEIGCLERKVWAGGKRIGKGRGKRKCESEAASEGSEVSKARVPRPEVLRGGVLGKRPSRRVAKGVQGYNRRRGRCRRAQRRRPAHPHSQF